MADDLKTVDTPAPETEERQVRIRGQEHTIRVPKGLTDDEIKRRLVAKSMAPSQTDFGTDVGYGILEGIGAVGARQLGENILEKSGVIPQAPAAPGAGQEGVVTDAKVPSGEPEGVTGGHLRIGDNAFLTCTRRCRGLRYDTGFLKYIFPELPCPNGTNPLQNPVTDISTKIGL